MHQLQNLWPENQFNSANNGIALWQPHLDVERLMNIHAVLSLVCSEEFFISI